MVRCKVVMIALGVCLIAGPAAARPTRSRPRATLYLETVAGGDARSVIEALESALTAREEYSATRIGDLLEPPAEADRRLADSRKQAEAGRAHLDGLELTEGVADFERAVQLAKSALPRLAESADGLARLAGLLVELGFAHHLAGNRGRCEQALSEAFVLNPSVELDRKKYPPEMQRVFESTRFFVDEHSTGTAQVTTEPRGAMVRVNGQPVGYGPVTADGLIGGPNLLTVSHPLFQTVTQTIRVIPGAQGRFSIRLAPQPGDVAGLLHDALDETRGRGGARLGSLARAASRLQRDLLIVGSVAVRGSVEVDLYAYDARAQRIAGRYHGRTAPWKDAERESATVIASLVSSFEPAAAATARPDRARGSSWLVRFYRSRYFWPVVGGVVGAAAIGTGVGLGVYYGTRGDNDRDRRLLVTLF